MARASEATCWAPASPHRKRARAGSAEATFLVPVLPDDVFVGTACALHLLAVSTNQNAGRLPHELEPSFTMPMNQESVWRRLMEVGPFASEDEARRAFEATLRALRRGLNEDEADWLAVALGPALAAPLLRESHAGELPKDELYRWMKRYTKARKGIAVEYAQVVCRVLTELLPEAELERVKRQLPELAFLFARPGPDEPTQTPHSRRREARELASSTPERVPAAHSVARAREPLGDTQRGSNRGLPQEREGHSFANGHGSARH